MSDIIQFDNLAQIGLLKDIPDLTLPNNGFSEAINVRFLNNAITKMEGELDLGEFGNGAQEIIYVDYWANPNLTPNNGYYVYVYTDGTYDYVCLRSVATSQVNVLYSELTGGTWQSTVFQGGYILILNNGKDVPKYISDKEGNTDISTIGAYDLVGWNDDYSTLEEVINLEFNSDTLTRDFSLGRELDFTSHKVLAYILDSDGEIKFRSEIESLGTEGEFTLTQDASTNTVILTASVNLENGDSIVIYIQSVDKVILTAGVIRAFGNLLIAGNLRETSVATGQIVRRLTGAIRTSDVAPPGSIPTNWNPFAAGVSTADEFILSSTGIVQDIVELQGRAYVYTNDSIHSIAPTGSPDIPFSLELVSSAYGCHSIDSVIEVDGKHMVVGSNDIYVFAGHPGNIQSIADSKVRYYFYNNLNKTHGRKLKVIRNQKYNELWFAFPNLSSTGYLNEVLIFNYRTAVWTKRIMSPFSSICTGLVEVNNEVDANQRYPIMASEDTLIACDLTYTDKNNNAYNSYLERTGIEIRPVFDTESLKGIYLYLQSENPVKLDLLVDQKNNPSEANSFVNSIVHDFYSNSGVELSDYKADVRITGRFMGYRISDGNSNTNNWILSSIAVQTAKAGRR